MRRRLKIISLLLFLPCFSAARASNYAFSFGPMFHMNFGKGPAAFSSGLECAFWRYPKFELFSQPPTVGYGIDFGVEKEKEMFRVYTEAQTGQVFMGAALGPVCEFSHEQSPRFGLQGSLWMNYLLGVDLRFRGLTGKAIVSPGLYGKLAI